MKSILILNAGSSSLKFKLFNIEGSNLNDIAGGQFSATNTNTPKFTIKIGSEKFNTDFNKTINVLDMIELLNKELNKHVNSLNIVAIGHRVVHGASTYIKPTKITNEVIDTLKNIIYLSPIHLPHNITPMEVCLKIFPNVPQVACFDTAFHSTIPEINSRYAIPREIADKYQIKRYGFHGLSYEYLISKLAEHDSKLASGKIVAAHLGAGASITAIKELKSVDTTMGFTPLEGLTMATRSGSIDPAIIFFLMQQAKLSAKEVEDILYFKSGILGISELSADFYTVSQSKEPKAIDAFNIFVSNVVKYIATMASRLEGLDAIIFAGGIGENSFEMRRDTINKLKWLGLELNESANKANEFEITTSSSKVKAFVIPTQEELVIAKHTAKLSNLI